MANGHFHRASYEEEGRHLLHPDFLLSVPEYQNATPLSMVDEYKSTSVEAVISDFNKAKILFTEKVCNVSGVSQIVSFQNQHVLYLWTILFDDNEETYKKIFRVERDIKKQFLNVRFDFFVFTEEEQKMGNIVPSHFSVLFNAE